jgi:hypothetical protein
VQRGQLVDLLDGRVDRRGGSRGGLLRGRRGVLRLLLVGRSLGGLLVLLRVLLGLLVSDRIGRADNGGCAGHPAD